MAAARRKELDLLYLDMGGFSRVAVLRRTLTTRKSWVASLFDAHCDFLMSPKTRMQLHPSSCEGF